jgi:hypothetical protein
MRILGVLYEWLRHTLSGHLVGKGQGPEPCVLDTANQAENLLEEPVRLENRQDDDRWTVTVHPVPKFEKVGRIFLDGGDLVLRSDRDGKGFAIRKRDVESALSGGTGEVWLLDDTVKVGTAGLSRSGRALNMVVYGKLYTVPLRLLMLVVEGKRRKVALFGEV